MRAVAIIAIAAIGSAAPSSAAAESASANVTVTATFASRTALNVSTKVLRFDIVSPDAPATASVDFAAKARTYPGSEVVLAVEPVRTIAGPRGVAATQAALTFNGVGEGTVGGTVQTTSTAVAGRWSGSGLRSGRLVFALRASERGSYSVPIRFVLTAP